MSQRLKLKALLCNVDVVLLSLALPPRPLASSPFSCVRIRAVQDAANAMRSDL
jgi:hypothetical protein